MSKKKFLAGAGIPVALCLLFFAGCPSKSNNKAAGHADPSLLKGTWISKKKGTLTIYEDFSFKAQITYYGKNFSIIGLSKVDLPVTGKVDFTDPSLDPNACILKDLRVDIGDLETKVKDRLENAVINAYIVTEPKFLSTYVSLAEDSAAKNEVRRNILQYAMTGPDAEFLVDQVAEGMKAIRNMANQMNLAIVYFTPADEHTKLTLSSQNHTSQKFWGGDFTKAIQ